MGILRIFFVHDRYPLLCPGIGNVGARSCKKKKREKKEEEKKLVKFVLAVVADF